MCVFFFKQKTAYEMRISDWSSDVCSSDLPLYHVDALAAGYHPGPHRGIARDLTLRRRPADLPRPARHLLGPAGNGQLGGRDDWRPLGRHWRCRYPVREPAIGRAHVCNPVTNAKLVCRLLLEKQKKHY